MPSVFPFRAVQYKGGAGDVSSLVAPPYDVLDARTKQALVSKDRHNIVSVDLPHTPAKELGPPEAYAAAAEMYRGWVREGVLKRREKPAMFAYRQTFSSGAHGAHGGERFERCGMACTVEAVPFGPRGGGGGGILPHEETFSGPKEDRLALMRATRAQMSPIFGLYADENGSGTAVVRAIMSRRGPDMTATMIDGVHHEVWTVDDERDLAAYRDALAGQDIFIADGHHRYTTQLNYLKELDPGWPDAPRRDRDDPAHRSMMVLVGMSDPGLVIWPTHRVLGGMAGYSLDAFLAAARGAFDIRPLGHDLTKVEAELGSAAFQAAETGGLKGRPTQGTPTQSALGLYDFASKQVLVATLKDADPLAGGAGGRFAKKPRAWRTLDVAIIQHLLVEEICQPKLNGGQPVKWAFPHTIDEVVQIGLGRETGAGGGAGFAPQLAVIVRPTPLEAVRAVSKAGELMPQKSTFFYPKLATGLWVNPLE